jgi:hypothetical protein
MRGVQSGQGLVLNTFQLSTRPILLHFRFDPASGSSGLRASMANPLGTPILDPFSTAFDFLISPDVTTSVRFSLSSFTFACLTM